MNTQTPPVDVTDDLEIIERVRRRLTPREALDLAEVLIRRGTRRMMMDEARDFTRGGTARNRIRA